MRMWLLLVVWSTVLAGPAWFSAAQEAGQGTPGEIDGEVRLSIRSLGVGGSARAGDWAGIQIEIEDLGPAQREVVLEVQTTDVDGDQPRYRRTITTNPGSGAERAWVYAFLQPDAADRPLIVSAYEAKPLDTEQAERIGVRFSTGRLLGRAVTQGSVIRPAEIAAMPVVGRAPGGLSGYELGGRASEPWLPYGHEVTAIAAGIEPADLPDRVAGLIPFETIVWTTAEPTRLTPARARALTQWIEMGGHLVVCLSATPQVWLDAARNPLAGLLPDVEFARSEIESERSAAAIRPLLSYAENVPIPDDLTVFDLVPRATAGSGEAAVVLRDRAGRAVVVRRLVGLGMVTLVGIDITNRQLSSRNLPTTRSFWHRVLGRTGLPDQDAEAVAGLQIAPRASPRYFDSDLADLIAKSQAVVLGVVAGLGIFGLYWLLAGPVSFLVLKRIGLDRLSWLAFVAGAAVFTLIAWGLVAAVRPSEPDARVIAFLDAVDGSDRASIRAFASVLVPSYGTGRVTLPTASDRDMALLAPWTHGGGSVVGAASFPDVRPYPVSGRGASSIEFPVRSTVKTLRADLFAERTWAMPRAVDAAGLEGSLRVNSRGEVSGLLSHGLPGPLTSGLLIVSPGQARLSRRVGRSDIADIRAYGLAPRYQSWAPGDVIDLAEFTRRPDGPQGARQLQNQLDYFQDLLGSGASVVPGLESGSRPADLNERLLAAAFMTRFPPPDVDRTGERPVALRQHTHGLDLGRWFSQPCVMILGTVELTPDMPKLLPWQIDTGGAPRPLPTSGRVVVRWVYPLPPAPPDASDPAGESGGAVFDARRDRTEGGS